MAKDLTRQDFDAIDATIVEPELNPVQNGSIERSTEPLTYTRTEAGELLEISNVMVSRRLKALEGFHPRHLLIDESDRVTEYGFDRIREYGELKKSGYTKKYPKLKPEIEEVEPEIEEPQQKGGALAIPGTFASDSEITAIEAVEVPQFDFGLTLNGEPVDLGEAVGILSNVHECQQRIQDAEERRRQAEKNQRTISQALNQLERQNLIAETHTEHSEREALKAELKARLQQRELQMQTGVKKQPSNG